MHDLTGAVVGPPAGSRDAAVATFLDRAGWGPASRRMLAGDASARRYERLAGADGTAVLMDAPPPGNDVRPFLRIGRLLRRLGLSAPAVLAEEVEAGLVLLEDLGDATYAQLLAEGGDEPALYALAVDALVALHRRVTPADVADVPAWSGERLLAEVERLLDWYWPALHGTRAPSPARESFVEAWRAMLPALEGTDRTVALFDFHVGNLMLLPERPGVAACGLLDFQDAVVAPRPFDLVSLLQDARRDVGATLAATMRARYLAAFPDLDVAAFDAAAAVIGAQRSIRIAGTFVRLAVRDGKRGYLPLLPRVWRLLEQNLAHAATEPLRRWLADWLPSADRRIPESAA